MDNQSSQPFNLYSESNADDLQATPLPPLTTPDQPVTYSKSLIEAKSNNPTLELPLTGLNDSALVGQMNIYRRDISPINIDNDTSGVTRSTKIVDHNLPISHPSNHHPQIHSSSLQKKKYERYRFNKRSLHKLKKIKSRDICPQYFNHGSNPLLNRQEEKENSTDPRKWSIIQVKKHISEVTNDAIGEIFINNEIDGHALLLLTKQDLIDIMKIKLGPSLNILSETTKLRERVQTFI